MEELTLHKENLPDTIEDLSRFVLVGREKLISVKAEIRAIDKVQLARDVRDQKRSEAQMLSEALLDAEVRLGEMLKAVPKAPGGRPEKTMDTAVHSFERIETHRTDAKSFSRPKHEVIAELGFSQKQAQRFETLANNKDLVEQVKAEARENDDLPTRSQVLSLAKARNDRYQRDMAQIDEDFNNLKTYRKPLLALDQVSTDWDYLNSIVRAVTPLKCERELYRTETGEMENPLDYEIGRLNAAITKLTVIRNHFRGERRKT